MNRSEDFKRVLAEWKVWKPPWIVEREVELPHALPSIVTVVGPRQAGKTFRLFQLVRELVEAGVPRDNILYVNFEHERLRRLDANDLEEMLKVYFQLFKPNPGHPIYLLLDEVQLVADWDKWVRRIHDRGGFRLYITGSTSKLTSREIADSLRGRSADYLVLPFSFREFLKARGFEVGDAEVLTYLEERGRVLGLLEEYLVYGGFPRVVLTEDPEEKRRVLKAHYEAIFYRDLVDRCKLDPELLDALLTALISSFAGLYSASKLHNYVKSLGLRCSKATLIKYVSCAQQAYLLFLSQIHSPSARSRRQYPRKAYVVDNGIITTLVPEAAENLGRLMENAVAVELVRRGWELRYWREYGRREGREVDFVLIQGLKVRQLVQVTYASSRSEVKGRELEALRKAGEELGCRDALIITWDYEGREEFEGLEVRYTPLWKWLLNRG
ncbi:MAG: ATP-binding protein [Thermofilaceae archaeon]